MSDQKLLQQFVDSFQRHDDMWAAEDTPLDITVKRDLNEWDSWKEPLRWHPIRIDTDRHDLAPLYSRVAGNFPILYERLVLSYRWLEVNLGIVRLLANPPGERLIGLTEAILGDHIFAEVLIPAGFVPFARAPSGNYNPVCFNLNAMTSQCDCPIFQFEHEAILSHSKIGEHWECWSSFRELMTEVIFFDSK